MSHYAFRQALSCHDASQCDRAWPCSRVRTSSARLGRARVGVTLIELLVVVGIVLTLASLAIPALRLLTKDVRVREAGRDLQVFFEEVRSDARIYGQAGVLIERDTINPHAAYRLHRVRVKPRYAGDVPNAKALIINDASDAGRVLVFFPAAQAQLMDPTLGVRGFGQAFNRVRLFNSDQFVYFLRAPADQTCPTTINGDAGFIYELIDRNGSKLAPKQALPPGRNPAGFQILPLPQKSSTSSLTLPKHVRIDLSRSGFGIERDVTAAGPALGFRKRFHSRLIVQDNGIDLTGLAEFDGAAPWISPDAPTPAVRAAQYDRAIPFSQSAPYTGAEFLGWRHSTGLDADVVAPDGSAIGVLPTARLSMSGDILIMFREDGSVDWVSNVWPKDSENPQVLNWLSVSNPYVSPNGLEAIVKLREMFCFDAADLFLLVATDDRDVDPNTAAVFTADPLGPLGDPVNLWASISRSGYFNLTEVDNLSAQAALAAPDATPTSVIAASRTLAKQQIAKTGQ